MWRLIVGAFLTCILAAFVICWLAIAAPGFLPLLLLLPVFHATALPSWEDELKAWLKEGL
ncbi:hypothetical protein [Microbacterium sp. NPDC055455]